MGRGVMSSPSDARIMQIVLLCFLLSLNLFIPVSIAFDDVGSVSSGGSCGGTGGCGDSGGGADGDCGSSSGGCGTTNSGGCGGSGGCGTPSVSGSSFSPSSAGDEYVFGVDTLGLNYESEIVRSVSEVVTGCAPGANSGCNSAATGCGPPASPGASFQVERPAIESSSTPRDFADAGFVVENADGLLPTSFSGTVSDDDIERNVVVTGNSFSFSGYGYQIQGSLNSALNERNLSRVNDSSSEVNPLATCYCGWVNCGCAYSGQCSWSRSCDCGYTGCNCPRGCQNYTCLCGAGCILVCGLNCQGGWTCTWKNIKKCSGYSKLCSSNGCGGVNCTCGYYCSNAPKSPNCLGYSWQCKSGGICSGQSCNCPNSCPKQGGDAGRQNSYCGNSAGPCSNINYGCGAGSWCSCSGTYCKKFGKSCGSVACSASGCRGTGCSTYYCPLTCMYHANPCSGLRSCYNGGSPRCGGAGCSNSGTCATNYCSNYASSPSPCGGATACAYGGSNCGGGGCTCGVRCRNFPACTGPRLCSSNGCGGVNCTCGYYCSNAPKSPNCLGYSWQCKSGGICSGQSCNCPNSCPKQGGEAGRQNSYCGNSAGPCSNINYGCGMGTWCTCSGIYCRQFPKSPCGSRVCNCGGTGCNTAFCPLVCMNSANPCIGKVSCYNGGSTRCGGGGCSNSGSCGTGYCSRYYSNPQPCGGAATCAFGGSNCGGSNCDTCGWRCRNFPGCSGKSSCGCGGTNCTCGYYCNKKGSPCTGASQPCGCGGTGCTCKRCNNQGWPCGGKGCKRNCSGANCGNECDSNCYSGPQCSTTCTGRVRKIFGYWYTLECRCDRIDDNDCSCTPQCTGNNCATVDSHIHPLPYAKVELWDLDDSWGDDCIATTYTNVNGYFEFAYVNNIDNDFGSNGGTQEFYILYYNIARKNCNPTDSNGDGIYDVCSPCAQDSGQSCTCGCVSIFYVARSSHSRGDTYVWRLDVGNLLDDTTFDAASRVPTDSRPTHVYFSILKAFEYMLENAQNFGMPEISVAFEASGTNGGDSQINIQTQYGMDDDAAIHEYGHCIMDRFYGGMPGGDGGGSLECGCNPCPTCSCLPSGSCPRYVGNVCNCGCRCVNHGGSQNTCSCDAIVEGWANFFAGIVPEEWDPRNGFTRNWPVDEWVTTKDKLVTRNLEDGTGGAGDANQRHEMCFASILWDIVDLTDDGETMSQPFSKSSDSSQNPIWYIMSGYAVGNNHASSVEPYTNREFWNFYISHFLSQKGQLCEVFANARAHIRDYCDGNNCGCSSKGCDACCECGGTGCQISNCSCSGSKGLCSSSAYGCGGSGCSCSGTYCENAPSSVLPCQNQKGSCSSSGIGCGGSGCSCAGSYCSTAVSSSFPCYEIKGHCYSSGVGCGAGAQCGCAGLYCRDALSSAFPCEEQKENCGSYGCGGTGCTTCNLVCITHPSLPCSGRGCGYNSGAGCGGTGCTCTNYCRSSSANQCDGSSNCYNNGFSRCGYSQCSPLGTCGVNYCNKYDPNPQPCGPPKTLNCLCKSGSTCGDCPPGTYCGTYGGEHLPCGGANNDLCSCGGGNTCGCASAYRCNSLPDPYIGPCGGSKPLSCNCSGTDCNSSNCPSLTACNLYPDAYQPCGGNESLLCECNGEDCSCTSVPVSRCKAASRPFQPCGGATTPDPCDCGGLSCSCGYELDCINGSLDNHVPCEGASNDPCGCGGGATCECLPTYRCNSIPDPYIGSCGGSKQLECTCNSAGCSPSLCAAATVCIDYSGSHQPCGPPKTLNCECNGQTSCSCPSGTYCSSYSGVHNPCGGTVVDTCDCSIAQCACGSEEDCAAFAADDFMPCGAVSVEDWCDCGGTDCTCGFEVNCINGVDDFLPCGVVTVEDWCGCGDAGCDCGFELDCVNGVDDYWLPGDADRDRTVNVFDILKVKYHWYPGPPLGPGGYDPNVDLNDDGAINVFDILIVKANWGKTCPSA